MVSTNFLISVASVVVLLGVLIFVHEMGHFLMAKYFNVGVLKFSLGFGRKLIGKKIGETEYVLSLIPLGGYVKMLGEVEGEALSPEDEKRSFVNQSVWKRMAIVFSGPLFNFFLAIVIFAIVYMVGVPVLTNEIGVVQQGGAASEAGMAVNDRVLKINGEAIGRWDQLAEKIQKSGGKSLSFSIQRGNEVKDLMVLPRVTKSRNIFGEEVETYKIGVGPVPKTVTERLNPWEACWKSLTQTWFITKMTFISIIKIFEGVLSPKNLGGPILIAQMAGEQVKGGVLPFILFMAMLSINLGVLNLLPIPVLDGGHLLFYIIEAIRGKDVGIKWKERAQQVGFILLIMLMIYVVIMDIDRLNIEAVNDVTKFFTGK